MSTPHQNDWNHHPVDSFRGNDLEFARALQSLEDMTKSYGEQQTSGDGNVIWMILTQQITPTYSFRFGDTSKDTIAM